MEEPTMTTVERAGQRAEVGRQVELNYYSGEGEPMGFLEMIDDLRASHNYYWSTYAQGFWVLTDMDGIREALQHPEIFSNTAAVATDPEPEYSWIPEMLDPPIHTKWRQNLAPFFAPGRMAQLEDRVRQRCVEIIEGFADQGHCDLRLDFGDRYPTSIFLELMGIPVEEIDQFMVWENGILNTPAELDPDRAIAIAAMNDTMNYFADVIKERRKDPQDDLVSIALSWQIDGKPIPEPDLLSMCLLMFMAGLDTVACQLAWSFYHLAQTPKDREWIVNDPSIIPAAIEEFLRAYTIVRPSRKVMQDIDFHGCPMKKGDMVFVPLAGACRDPKVFEDADQVILDRAPNNHIAFGAGPHRCVGSHLARRELRVAFEEWHKRIPNYRLAEGAEIKEYGGAELGIVSVPLVWDV
jgi:cytochrome P450